MTNKNTKLPELTREPSYEESTDEQNLILRERALWKDRNWRKYRKYAIVPDKFADRIKLSKEQIRKGTSCLTDSYIGHGQYSYPKLCIFRSAEIFETWPPQMMVYQEHYPIPEKTTSPYGHAVHKYIFGLIDNECPIMRQNLWMLESVLEGKMVTWTRGGLYRTENLN